MRTCFAVLLSTFLLLGIVTQINSQPSCEERFSALYPRQYVSFYTTFPPAMDGKLDDAIWAEVPWTENFVDISTNVTPRFETRAKMRWDDNFLYVGAQLQEPDVWANITQHNDVIFHDNDFEVFVDADGSTHNYKEFEMNALNATWDLLLNKPYDDGGYENSTRVFPNNGWEMQPPLFTAAFVDGQINNPEDSRPNKFWSVEIALPLQKLAEFKSVPLPPREGTLWRINFSRVEWRVIVSNNTYQKDPNCPAEDNWVWSPQGAIAMHLPERWGFLQFSRLPPSSQTPPRFAPDWGVRCVAMDLYYAQHAYANANNGTFSASISDLVSLAPNGFLDGQCSLSPFISLTNGGKAFEGVVADYEQNVAHIRDDRLLTTEVDAVLSRLNGK